MVPPIRMFLFGAVGSYPDPYGKHFLVLLVLSKKARNLRTGGYDPQILLLKIVEYAFNEIFLKIFPGNVFGNNQFCQKNLAFLG